jgi:hypothetical protein
MSLLAVYRLGERRAMFRGDAMTRRVKAAREVRGLIGRSRSYNADPEKGVNNADPGKVASTKRFNNADRVKESFGKRAAKIILIWIRLSLRLSNSRPQWRER